MKHLLISFLCIAPLLSIGQTFWHDVNYLNEIKKLSVNDLANAVHIPPDMLTAMQERGELPEQWHMSFFEKALDARALRVNGKVRLVAQGLEDCIFGGTLRLKDGWLDYVIVACDLCEMPFKTNIEGLRDKYGDNWELITRKSWVGYFLEWEFYNAKL